MAKRDPLAALQQLADYAADTGQQVHDVVIARDTSELKHAKELLGTTVNPDLTPPNLRHVRNGYCLIEWVGDVSPYNNEQIFWAVRTGRMPDKIVAAYELHRLGMIPRVDGHTRRITKPGEYSQVYTWGSEPGTYIVEVAIPDAIKLLDSPCGGEFRRVGRDAPRDAADLIEIFVPERLRAMVRAIEVEKGIEEKLVGVLAANPRMGQFERV